METSEAENRKEVVRSTPSEHEPRAPFTLAGNKESVTLNQSTQDRDQSSETFEPPVDPDNHEFNYEDWLRGMFRNPETSRKSKMSVAYRDLNVYGFGTQTDYQKTFANYPLMYLSLISTFFRRQQKSKIEILQDFEGLVETGERLVVLGRPGSGCTTLLKTLAGQTYGFCVDDKSKINYQGVPSRIMHREFRGECVYLAETDMHFANLTVSQMLTLAAEARCPKNACSVRNRKAHTAKVRDATAAALGLSNTLDTKVGNDFIRGVSGGERKRASIAEVLVGGSAIQCWDNSTRGLDSTNALKFSRALRSVTTTTGSVAIVSLYQASQDIFETFNKVVLLYEGRQIFFGDTRTAKQYFVHLGFVCSARTTTADFLTSLTNPTGRVVRKGYESRVPRTADDFARVWKLSTERAKLRQAIEDYESQFPLSERHLEKLRQAQKAQKATGQRQGSPYMISLTSQVRLCIARGLQRLQADIGPPISAIIGNCVTSVILGSMFYNMPEDTTSFFGRGVVLFFTILLNTVLGAFEGVVLWDQRPIVEKHYQYAFYHPLAEAISSMICDLPNKILLTFFFNVPFYFLANLRRTAAAFLTFYLFAFASLVTGSMIFRLIGAMSRTLSGSLAPGAVFILLLTIYAGFVIPTANMHPWLRWFAYVNPIGYAFESLMVNEFSGRQFPCSRFVPQGIEYSNTKPTERMCAVVGAELGSSLIDGDAYLAASFGYHANHLWRNLGIIFAIMVSVCALYLLSTEYVSIERSRGEVLLFRRSHVRGSSNPHDDEENRKCHELPAVCTKAYDHSFISAGKTADHEIQATNFVWDELSYDVKHGKGSRRLLEDLEGWIKPGTLTALMGASGAGKTTLLNCLANRTPTGVVHGEMLVDLRYRDNGFARKVGYAQQQDLHLATSTVREALEFSALLRQSDKYSKTEKLAYVDKVVEILEMRNFADGVIGVPGEGLNVEQRKRVTIGVELAARPELLLFLDEPTSGLDSDTAWTICTLLRRLADNGQAVLCTIHQPSGVLFQMFDKLLFLCKGRSAYFGDIGRDSEVLISYFERHGARKCGSDENPAEWLLDVTGNTPGSKSTIDWTDVWKSSDHRGEIKAHIARLKEALSKPASVSSLSTVSQKFATSTISQLYIVSKRNFKHDWRTPSYLWSKAFTTLGLAFFNGLSFWHSENSLQGVQNQLFSVFILMTMFQNIVQLIMPQFLTNRTLYESRERPSRTYSWYVFIMSNILAEIPSQTLMAMLVFASWYYPLGMYRNAIETDQLHSRGCLVFLILWSFMIFSSTFSQMVMTVMPDAATGINISSLLFMLSLLFSGVLVSPTNLPRFWIFMYRVSPVTYFVNALTSTAVAGVPIVCAANEVVQFHPPTGQTCLDYLTDYMRHAGGTLINNPNATTTTTTQQCRFCPVADTNTLLATLGIYFDNRWRNFAISLVYSAFNTIGAFALYWLARVWRSQA